MSISPTNKVRSPSVVGVIPDVGCVIWEATSHGPSLMVIPQGRFRMGVLGTARVISPPEPVRSAAVGFSIDDLEKAIIGMEIMAAGCGAGRLDQALSGDSEPVSILASASRTSLVATLAAAISSVLAGALLAAAAAARGWDGYGIVGLWLAGSLGVALVWVSLLQDIMTRRARVDAEARSRRRG